MTVSKVASNQVVVRQNMNTVPDEIVIMFFACADHKDLCQFAVVNRRWLKLAGNGAIWKGLVDQRFNLPFPQHLSAKEVYRYGFVQTALDQSLFCVLTQRHCDWEVSLASGGPKNHVVVERGKKETKLVTGTSNNFRIAIDGTSLFAFEHDWGSSSIGKQVVHWNYQTRKFVQTITLPVMPSKSAAEGVRVYAMGDLFISWEFKNGNSVVYRLNVKSGAIAQQCVLGLGGKLCAFPQAVGKEMAGQFRFYRKGESKPSAFPLQKGESVLLLHNDLVFLGTTFDDGFTFEDIHVRNLSGDILVTIPRVMESETRQFKSHIFGEMVTICKNPPKPPEKTMWQKFMELF